MATIIDEVEKHYDAIYNLRMELSDLRKERAEQKAPLWEEAVGTVDAKKDYIKSKISHLDSLIAKKEAEIEYKYNLAKLKLLELEQTDG